MKRVLLDCDGVLADFHSSCLAVINDLLGTSHSLADIVEWNIFDSLRISRDDRARIYDVMHRDEWCGDIAVYPGAREGVALLRRYFDVYVVTSPMKGPTWCSEREKWLGRNFGLPRSRVVHTSSKEICVGVALIDDKDDNLGVWHSTRVLEDGAAATRIPIKWVSNHAVPNKWRGHSFWDWRMMVDFLRARTS